MSARKNTGKSKMEIEFIGKELSVPYSRQREFLSAQEHDHDGELSWRVLKIQSEFVKGYDFLGKYHKAVSFFGTARNGFDEAVYRDAYDLAYALAKKDFAIFTGGGPGVMEAANKGAKEAGGHSVGINILLPSKKGSIIERRNPYITDAENFDFFFSRKVILSFASQFYIFFPGGFGTLDELFEMLTLIQTGKTSPVPVILVGKEYWTPLMTWIRETLCQKNKSISPEDLDLYHLVADADEALKCITESCTEKK